MRDRRSDVHRRVVEQTTGQPIPPGVDVHHLDENKDNNAPHNLQPLPHGEHSKVTGSKRNRTLRHIRKSLNVTRDTKLY